ncbi:MAG: hypothetical protein GF405_05410 [Candidatus Eisenbacteria bacterium]|nr:hypothetical protein [Candidatus Eisenbacteria bacterium]
MSRGAFLAGVLVVLLAATLHADVIPISDVNADDVDGFPILWDEVVTVRGVVTVGTGLLDSTNDIYIQDTTGGVNVIQDGMTSPSVAAGDSVLVTGQVVVQTASKRTAVFVSTMLVPGSSIEVLNSGNPLPEPIELDCEDIYVNGEDWEGSYVVVRDVSLLYSWPPSCPQNGDGATQVADDDTLCWLWLDNDTDVCGSRAPLESFDVYGIVTPDPRSNWQPGHGVLPAMRSWILSLGPGSGTASVNPDRVYTSETVTIDVDVEGEGSVLSRVDIAIPDGWTWSGDVADVSLSGDGFSGASVLADSTSASRVSVTGASLESEVAGTVTISGLGTPASAVQSMFVVSTGSDSLAELATSPVVDVGASADEGVVLINEIYAVSKSTDSRDRAEFVELYNPGGSPVDLTGWVLTDVDDSGECGANLWEFPAGAEIGAGEYLVIAKDTKRTSSQGFNPVFGFNPDYELYDAEYGDVDWPGVDNLTLVASSTEEGSREIRLVGGYDENGTLVANTPAYEAVYLYSDRTKAYLVDAVEYRDPVFLDTDACTGAGLGGTADAWVPGPPPTHYSLGRDELSTDTDVSSADLVLSSTPTPGEVNVVTDDLAPEVESVQGAGSEFLLVVFNEPVDEGDAEDLGSYDVDRTLDLNSAWLSRDGRTVLISTSRQVPDEQYTMFVTGIDDVAGNALPDTSVTFSGYFDDTTPIAETQAWNDDGFSQMVTEEVAVVGFTTVPPGVFQPDRTNMYIQGLDDWGINLYSNGLVAQPPIFGDLVKASGSVTDYVSASSGAGATTEIDDAVITVLARGFDIIEPVDLPSGDVNDERYEGAFVKTSGVVISVEGFAYFIDDGSGSIQVYQNFSDLDFSEFALGDSVEVQGVILQYDLSRPYFSGYELAPRYQSDMIIRDAHYSSSAEASLVVDTENEDRLILNIDADQSIQIAYNAPRSSYVSIQVFDLQGRSVATLYDGLSLGPQRVSWDGRDDEGLKVPVGVYICHVQSRSTTGGSDGDAAIPIVVGRELE